MSRLDWVMLGVGIVFVATLLYLWIMGLGKAPERVLHEYEDTSKDGEPVEAEDVTEPRKYKGDK